MKKKNYLLFIPSIFLVFISTYLFLGIMLLMTEPYSRRTILFYFIIFLVVGLINCLYLYLLVRRKFLNTKELTYVIPMIGIFFLFFSFVIIFRPYERVVYFDFGEDPFIPDSSIGGMVVFNMLEKDFYLPKSILIKKYWEEERLKDQVTRQGSLIGHVGIDLQGWNSGKVLNAFGPPPKIEVINENLEKWIYYPWTSNPEWEMPVYIQNSELLKIGD